MSKKQSQIEKARKKEQRKRQDWAGMIKASREERISTISRCLHYILKKPMPLALGFCTASIVDANKNEATGLLVRLAEEKLPRAEGWYDYRIVTLELWTDSQAA